LKRNKASFRRNRLLLEEFKLFGEIIEIEIKTI